jgi:hypothetical protein
VGIITIPPGESNVQARLQYPYFKPRPGKENTLLIYILAIGDGSIPFEYRAIFTDGIQTLTHPWWEFATSNYWIYTGGVQELPADWITNQSRLIIDIKKDDLLGAQIAIDGLSVLYISAKKQYLPLVGIG